MRATAVKFVFAAGSLMLVGSAFAQYKSIAPDGSVTYSDRPPPATSRLLNEKKPRETSVANPPLPFELQAAVSKYPVVLYTGDGCGPCNDARAFLQARGVPFTEKTVSSSEDIAQFKQQSPDGTAPVVTVGNRKSIGFSQPSLSSTLDSAGYPAQSVLPRDWQNPAPTPLVAVARPTAETARQPSTAAAAPRPVTPPATTPGTPPGFRF